MEITVRTHAPLRPDIVPIVRRFASLRQVALEKDFVNLELMMRCLGACPFC